MLPVRLTQGQEWQFKDWPLKTVTAIMQRMCGFHVQFSDEVPNQTVKGWSVTKLVFSKERSKRHEVGVCMMLFWQTIHKFLSNNKPHLLKLPKEPSMV